MSKLTDNIRTYSVDGTREDIPKLAEEFGLRVTLGIWISPGQERNEREILRAIELANTSRCVVRVVQSPQDYRDGGLRAAVLL